MNTAASNNIWATIRKYSWLLLTIIFAIIILFQMYQTISYAGIAPIEVREGVGFKYAVDFAKGINPYSLEVLSANESPAINHYGLVMTMFLSLFVRLWPTSYVTAIRIAAYIVKLLGCFFFAKGLYTKTNNKLISALSVFFIYALYQFPVYPCTWALALSYLLYWIIAVDEKNNKSRWYWYVLIIILLFYTKQYFVTLALGVLLYLIFQKSWKIALKYTLSGLIFGILSMIIINKIFPLYFTQSFLFVGTASSGATSVSYLLVQLIDIIFSLFSGLFIIILSVILLLLVAYFISRKKKETISDEIKSFWNHISYGMITFLSMIPVLYFLGQNTGSYNRYFYELWIPYLLDVVLCFIAFINEYYLNNKQNNLFSSYVTKSVLAALVLFSLASVFRNFYRPYFPNAAEDEQWNDVYELVKQEAPTGNFFSSSVLSFYCISNDIPAYDYGSNQYCDATISDKINSGWKEKLFPYATELNDKVINDRNEAYQKISEGKFDLVVLTDDLPYYSGLADNLKSGGYTEIKKENLVIGGRAWVTHFYAKK